MTNSEKADISALMEKISALEAKNAENEQKLAGYAELHERLARMENGAETAPAATVSLYCAVNLAEDIKLSVAYDNGKRLIFDKLFQRKILSAEEFETFASSLYGGRHLEKRDILVGGDVPERIAKTWDVQYKPGEVYDKNWLMSALDVPVTELAEVYGALCKSHRENVARMFVDAYARGDKRATKEKAAALHEAGGLLKGVLKEMAEKEAESL